MAEFEVMRNRREEPFLFEDETVERHVFNVADISFVPVQQSICQPAKSATRAAEVTFHLPKKTSIRPTNPAPPLNQFVPDTTLSQPGTSASSQLAYPYRQVTPEILNRCLKRQGSPQVRRNSMQSGPVGGLWKSTTMPLKKISSPIKRLNQPSRKVIPMAKAVSPSKINRLPSSKFESPSEGFLSSPEKVRFSSGQYHIVLPWKPQQLSLRSVQGEATVDEVPASNLSQGEHPTAARGRYNSADPFPSSAIKKAPVQRLSVDNAPTNTVQPKLESRTAATSSEYRIPRITNPGLDELSFRRDLSQSFTSTPVKKACAVQSNNFVNEVPRRDIPATQDIYDEDELSEAIETSYASTQVPASMASPAPSDTHDSIRSGDSWDADEDYVDYHEFWKPIAQWPRAATLKLIKFYKERKEDFESNRFFKIGLWQKIASEFRPYTALQCQRRWYSLSKKYWQQRDTTNSNDIWFDYFYEMDAVLGETYKCWDRTKDLRRELIETLEP